MGTNSSNSVGIEVNSLSEYGASFGLPVLETDALDVVNLQAVNGLNAAFLLGNALLPLSGDEVSYRVAAGLPLKTAAIDALEQFLGVTVKVELASGAWIREQLNRLYAVGAVPTDPFADGASAEEAQDDDLETL